MNNILDKINNARYVMIVSDVKHLAVSSALYTHILRLHKKVSLVCLTEQVDVRLSFLPWFDKIKTFKVASCDTIIDMNYSSIEFYDFFKKSGLKINPKMATALYGGLLQETDGFLNSVVDSRVFAMAKELIECGAEYKVCSSFIMKRTTLATLRLKALMLKNMILQNSAKAAIFCICNDDLKSTGALIEDSCEIIEESLMLNQVEMAILLNLDKEYEVLKLIYKE